MTDLETTLTVVLAGGVGSRLHPLTEFRAKPAVPFGGIYRIIDFTLSNCLHSGLRRILVLTQYKSHSLQKHLRDGWSIFNPEIGEYITAVPAQMRMGEEWYAGTADAIQQNRYLLERSGASHVLVLAGDHIYRMDYARMLENHIQKKNHATVGCVPVPRDSAKSFGVVEVDEHSRIRGFIEKSDRPPSLPGDPDHVMASMGIYMFDMPFLLEILSLDQRDGSSQHDFGRNIIPKIVASHQVGAYFFGGTEGRVSQDGYWRDVGTLDAYYDAHMDLLMPVPPLNLYQRDWAIRTYHGQYPSARLVASPAGDDGSVTNSLLADGDIIIGARIHRSILSPDIWVQPGGVIEDSILFEGVRVGEGAQLHRCIVDKGVVIPPKETIGKDLRQDRSRFTVSQAGVVVIPKNYRF